MRGVMQGRDKGSGYEGVFVGNRGPLCDRGDSRSSPLLSLWGPLRSLSEEMRGARDRVTTQVDLAYSQAQMPQQGRVKEMKCGP